MRGFSMYCVAALSAITLFVIQASAAIPAGYAGTPWPAGSAPRELLGRINFNEYDLGGINVAFYADDAWGGAPGRTGQPGSAFFCTNDNIVDRDTFYAAGVVWPKGVRYPDPVDTMVQDCYVGASHGNSWTKWTVHVSKAGKYWISSIWSAMEQPFRYHISFLNGTNTVSTPSIQFQQEASYHAWRRYSDFASIQLDTGVQVMWFQNETNHLNQDFLYFAADSGQFPTGVIQPAVSPNKNHSDFNLSVGQKACRFSLQDAGMTRISVFDCLGREITCVMNKNLGAGEHTALLPAANLEPGVYFLHIKHNAENSVVRFEVIAK